MNLPRVVKIGAALMSGQGLNLLNQLLLPPLFIRHYGVSVYGEWLTLYAAVNYLVTLNLGLHTFANTEVCIAYQRGETEQAIRIQATAFAILLSIVISLSVCTAAILFCPISAWLHLKTSSREASIMVYLLGLQVLTRMVGGFIAGSFLVIGAAHRREIWNNIQSLLTLAGTVALVIAHARFSVIATQQLATSVVCLIAATFDLRRKAPAIFPDLRFAEWSRVASILKPSSHFALLFSSNFLVYELPIILIQRILGATPVVVFAVSRTIYSMSRQALTILSLAIAPEIVDLYAQKNWLRLFRLYEVSERIVCALIPVTTFGTLLATPVLMTIWLHKPTLYRADVCIYMALISGVIAIKEHKFQFHAAINRHSEVARFFFGSYALMAVSSVGAVMAWGICGFLALWLITEIAQFIFIMRLSRRLFDHFARLDLSPVYRLLAVVGVATVTCSAFATEIQAHPSLLLSVAATAIAVTLLSASSYWLFGVQELRQQMTRYLAQHLRPEQCPTI